MFPSTEHFENSLGTRPGGRRVLSGNQVASHADVGSPVGTADKLAAAFLETILNRLPIVQLPAERGVVHRVLLGVRETSHLLPVDKELVVDLAPDQSDRTVAVRCHHLPSFVGVSNDCMELFVAVKVLDCAVSTSEI